MRYEESHIQKIIVNWVARKYPDLLFTCAPAVAKSARQGHENRLMGYKKGWPDLFFAAPRKSFNGLFIELKVPGGKVSPEQVKVLEDLIGQGYKACICRSPEEAITLIEGYLK